MVFTVDSCGKHICIEIWNRDSDGATLSMWQDYLNIIFLTNHSDSWIHGTNMRPIWVLSAPDGPMLAPWTLQSGQCGRGISLEISSTLVLFIFEMIKLCFLFVTDIVYFHVKSNMNESRKRSAIVYRNQESGIRNHLFEEIYNTCNLQKDTYSTG